MKQNTKTYNGNKVMDALNKLNEDQKREFLFYKKMLEKGTGKLLTEKEFKRHISEYMNIANIPVVPEALTKIEKHCNKKHLMNKEGVYKEFNVENCFRPGYIANFNPIKCAKFIKNKVHCKDTCASQYFLSYDDKNQLHELVKLYIYEEFYLKKVNTIDSAYDNKGRIYETDKKAREDEINDFFKHYNKYTTSDLKRFIVNNKGYIDRLFTSFIINEGCSLLEKTRKKSIVLNGMKKYSRILEEVNFALENKKHAYASELMFYAGRLFERINVAQFNDSVKNDAITQGYYRTKGLKIHKKDMDKWSIAYKKWDELMSLNYAPKNAMRKIAVEIYGADRNDKNDLYNKIRTVRNVINNRDKNEKTLMTYKT